jgi:class 3 adenylate cyclase
MKSISAHPMTWISGTSRRSGLSIGRNPSVPGGRAGLQFRSVVRLDSSSRTKLPDRAFAYVDSQGKRRLPIHDAAHVRNALARFNQVAFEDEASRDQARKRLLNAAKKFRIVPVGFIDGQLRSERGPGRTSPVEDRVLPSGFLTLLMTDVEGSTGLLARLRGKYEDLIVSVRDVQRDCVVRAEGLLVTSRADDLFAVFLHPARALEAAIDIHRQFEQRTWPGSETVRVRIGVHSGYPTLRDDDYIGMAVHVAARTCSVAHGGQILVSEDTRLALSGCLPGGVRLRNLGRHRLRGIPEETSLFQVLSPGLASRFPPPRTGG